MSYTEPSHNARRMRLPRLSPVAWVLLALAAGTTPWLAMAVSLVWPSVLP